MLQNKIRRTWLILIVAMCSIAAATRVTNAQRRLLSDYFVRPAQGAIPGPYGPGQYGNPGVALQQIQPFDPYASTAPSLPPPLSGGSYAPAYPAPPGNLSAPPIAPRPVIPPSNYGPGYNQGGAFGGGQSGSLFGGGSYQPFNFNGGGLYGGFEAPFLQPRYGSFAITTDAFGPSTTVATTPKHDLAFSTRFIAGFEGPGGLGFRARWWHFDDETNGTGAITRSGNTFDATTSAQLEADAIDMELTQAGRFHNWEFLVSGGVRYADIGSKIESSFVLPPDRFIRTTSGFTGVGPVLSLGTRRSLRQWEGLTFVFNSRFSFLFGDHDVRNISDVRGVIERENLASVQDVMPNWELQIGAHWTRRLNSGSTFYLGAFFEAQLWDWISPGQINSDLGFWGPTFAVGISQ
ncbi:Lpg1974 family pore-forming outer membrane protein [Planctomycetota bacterium]